MAEKSAGLATGSPSFSKALPGVVAVFAGEELVGDMRPMEIIQPEKVWWLIQVARADRLEQPEPNPPDVFTSGGKLDDGSTPAFL